MTHVGGCGAEPPERVSCASHLDAVTASHRQPAAVKPLARLRRSLLAIRSARIGDGETHSEGVLELESTLAAARSSQLLQDSNLTERKVRGCQSTRASLQSRFRFAWLGVFLHMWL